MKLDNFKNRNHAFLVKNNSELNYLSIFLLNNEYSKEKIHLTDILEKNIKEPKWVYVNNGNKIFGSFGFDYYSIVKNPNKRYIIESDKPFIIVEISVEMRKMKLDKINEII